MIVSQQGGETALADAAKVRANGYREKFGVYAERFGYSERAVKGWVGEGRAVGDPCPLDDPAAMPDWWSRVKPKRSVPARILAAANGPADEPGEEAAEDLPLFRPAAPAAPVEVEGGLRAAVVGLRDAEARARGAYLEAVEAVARETDEAKAKSLESSMERKRRAWADLSKELRTSEKALLEVEKQQGEALSRAEVRAELTRIHAAIYTGIKNLVRRVRPKLEGKLSTEQDHVWTVEVNRLFEAYQDGSFSPGFVTDDGGA